MDKINTLRQTIILTVPKTAKSVTITSTITGWVWIQPMKTGLTLPTIAWDERGWLIVTSPVYLPRNQKQWTSEAVSTARTLVSKIMVPMLGQTGTIYIANAADGLHTTAMWRRAQTVYSIFADYGVSSATTVIGSLYPASTGSP